MELAHKNELVHHLHLPVEPALFRQVPNPLQALTGKWPAEQIYCAGIRHGNSHHHADARGLPCSVGPQQAKHGARFYSQIQIAYRHLLLVRLRHMIELHQGRHS